MRLFLQIISVIVIVLTVCICAIKPDMHKNVIVFNSDYKLIPETIEMIEKEDIKIVDMPVKPIQETVRKEINTVNEPKTVKIAVKTEPIAITNDVKKIVNKIPQNAHAIKETIPEQKEVEPITVKEIEKPEPKKVEKVQSPLQTKAEPKVSTKEQEEIAWNVWRSNLQNKIMQDVRLPNLPYGIVFKFSFTVDKYGKVSNVYTYSTTATYTPYAIQYIAPVIRGYQGKSILNFPEGSTRTITDVTGGWKLSNSEKYSTPNDYNDVERIVR